MFATVPIGFRCPECGKNVSVMFSELNPSVRVLCFFCGAVIIAGNSRPKNDSVYWRPVETIKAQSGRKP